MSPVFRKSFTALVVLLCLLISALLSEAFVLTHAEHTHDHNGAGGSCAVCVQIHNAESFLKLFKTAVNNVHIPFFFFLAVILISCGVFVSAAFKTPVQLKSRMNN